MASTANGKKGVHVSIRSTANDRFPRQRFEIEPRSPLFSALDGKHEHGEEDREEEDREEEEAFAFQEVYAEQDDPSGVREAAQVA